MSEWSEMVSGSVCGMVSGSYTTEIAPDCAWTIEGSELGVFLWAGRYWLRDKDRKVIETSEVPEGFESRDFAVGYALGKGLL